MSDQFVGSLVGSEDGETNRSPSDYHAKSA